MAKRNAARPAAAAAEVAEVAPAPSFSLEAPALASYLTAESAPAPALPPAPRAASNRAYPDNWVVRLCVDANPKRGKSAERFALYRDGMTVGEYLDASSALTGSKRGKWSCDLRWDAERGYIVFDIGGGLTVSEV